MLPAPRLPLVSGIPPVFNTGPVDVTSIDGKAGFDDRYGTKMTVFHLKSISPIDHC